MTREEKCKIAISLGIKYEKETGKVFGIRGKEIKCKNDGYIQIGICHNNKHFFLKAHQFGYYCVYNKIVEQIDHKNGIRDDNRITNLRSVTHQENQFNRIGVKGYTYNKKRNKYQSQIWYNNKSIYLGRFDTEEEAREVYLKAKNKYHIYE
jgi:hypothetical protein